MGCVSAGGCPSHTPGLGQSHPAAGPTSGCELETPTPALLNTNCASRPPKSLCVSRARRIKLGPQARHLHDWGPAHLPSLTHTTDLPLLARHVPQATFKTPLWACDSPRPPGEHLFPCCELWEHRNQLSVTSRCLCTPSTRHSAWYVRKTPGVSVELIIK